MNRVSRLFGQIKAMGQNSNKVAQEYDTVAKEYAEKFCGEHEKKPLDREILFAKKPIGIKKF